MKYILSYVLCCISVHTAIACGVCGAGADVQASSTLPALYGNYIAVQYQYAGFRAEYPSLMGDRPATLSHNHYNSLQLTGRYSISPGLQLQAFLPYQINKQVSAGHNQRQQGIGDVTVQGNATVLRRSQNSAQHLLQAGMGVKMPTGAHAANDIQGTGLPETMPGTGSWDGSLQVNYTYTAGKWMHTANTSYILTTANRQGYKYGNRFSISARSYYKLQKGKASLLPQLGIRYEYALHDYDNYRLKWLNEQTGGSICYATAGLQAYYGPVGIMANYYLPVAQQYAGGLVSSTAGADAGLFIVF